LRIRPDLWILYLIILYQKIGVTQFLLRTIPLFKENTYTKFWNKKVFLSRTCFVIQQLMFQKNKLSS